MSSNFVYADYQSHILGGDPRTTSRDESWTYELIQDGQVVRELEGIKPGGRLTFNSQATVKTGGKLTRAHDEDIDWDTHELRISYSFSSIYGSMSWPLGTYLVTTPEDLYGKGPRTQELELMDKLAIFDGDMIENTFVAKKGGRITAYIKQLADSVNQKVLITSSTATMRVTQVWNPGTTKLRIINDLLAMINYFSLYADRNGQLRADPDSKPMKRPISWDFEPGRNCIYNPVFSHTRDRYRRPNKLIAMSHSDGDEPGLRGVAYDFESYAKLGYWITETEDAIEAADQKTLTAIAEKRLAAIRSSKSVLEVSHAPLPLDPNSRVTFSSSKIEKLNAVVQSMTLTLTAGGLTQTYLREIDSNA